MATFRPCPDCAKKGIVSPVVPRRVNEETAIWKCNSSTCIYPMSQSVEFFKAQFVPVSSIDERLFCRYVHYNIVRSECCSDETGESSLSPTPDDKKDVKCPNLNDVGQQKNSPVLSTQQQNTCNNKNLVDQTADSSMIKNELDDENNALSFLTDAFAAMDDDGYKKVKNVKSSNSNKKKRRCILIEDDECITQNVDEQKTVKKSPSPSPVANMVVVEEKKKEEKKSARQYLKQLMATKRLQPTANRNFPTSSSNNNESAQNKQQSNSTTKFAKSLLISGSFHHSRTPVTDSFEPMVLTSQQKQTPFQTDAVSLDDVKPFANKKKFPGYMSRGGGSYGAASSSETKSECDSDSLKRSKPLTGAKSSLSSNVKRTLVKSLKDAFASVVHDNAIPDNDSTIRNDSTLTAKNVTTSGQQHQQQQQQHYQSNVYSPVAVNYEVVVTHANPLATTGPHHQQQQQQKTAGVFYPAPSLATSQAQLVYGATESFPILDVQQPLPNTMYPSDPLSLHVTATNEFDLNSDSAFFDYTSPNILDDSSSLLFSTTATNSNILSDNGLDYCEL